MPNRKNHIDPSWYEFVYRFFQKFMPLSRPEVEELLRFCEFRHFDKKEIVLKEGEVDDHLNMVVKGLVIKSVKVKSSHTILQLATEGHIIHSELSYFSRTPSPVVLQVLEPTTLLSMSYTGMNESLEKFPKAEMLARVILEGMYIKKDERKFIWQSMNVRQRFLDYVTHHPHMMQRVPQKILASYLNIKPETFSRLKHLIRNKS